MEHGQFPEQARRQKSGLAICASIQWSSLQTKAIRRRSRKGLSRRKNVFVRTDGWLIHVGVYFAHADHFLWPNPYTLTFWSPYWLVTKIRYSTLNPGAAYC